MSPHRRIVRVAFCVAALFGCLIMLPAEEPRPTAAVATAVKNVAVFDGEKLLPPCTVVMHGGRITALGENPSIPPGAEVIDGTGKTLLPGLFDAHVHIWQAQNLKQSLVFGVTTVVDMFMDVTAMNAIKKTQDSGQASDMAYLLSPGILATSPGGHGTQYGLPIPTLAVLEGFPGDSGAPKLIEDPALAPFLTPDDFQMLKMTFPFTIQEGAYAAEEKALRQLAQAGVPILAGMDAPNPGTTYGASLRRELELLVKAGLSPLEALRSATSIPAQTFGLTGRGVIKEGLIADCVLVEGDPSQDIKNTRRIVAVWRAGIRVDRDVYQTAVEKAIKARADLKYPLPVSSRPPYLL